MAPRLMLSQNAPFTPIYDSWKTGRRELIELDASIARTLAEKIVATVLSNHRPPYSITGGMFDVLSASRGDVFAVDNEEILRAAALFEQCEGIDIEPAAGAALAALQKAAGSGQVSSDAVVLSTSRAEAVAGWPPRRRCSRRRRTWRSLCGNSARMRLGKGLALFSLR